MKMFDMLVAGKLFGGGGDKPAVLQEKSVTPTTQIQIVAPDSEYEGLSKVTVNGVTADIDSNITPNNIRQGIEILGVEGNLAPDKPDQTKTVAPSTSQQIVVADTGYELASVTVDPVTSEIDDNIVAENIKNGVSILGVEGTLIEGVDTSDATATANDIVTGKTAYVNGIKVNGEIVEPYSGRCTVALSVNTSATSKFKLSNYYNGTYARIPNNTDIPSNNINVVYGFYKSTDSMLSEFINVSQNANVVTVNIDGTKLYYSPDSDGYYQFAYGILPTVETKSFVIPTVVESDITQETTESETIVTIHVGYISEPITLTMPPVTTGFPLEVSTEAEMTAVLSNVAASDIGKIYKYTGTTGTYTQGELYILQEG